MIKNIMTWLPIAGIGIMFLNREAVNMWGSSRCYYYSLYQATILTLMIAVPNVYG